MPQVNPSGAHALSHSWLTDENPLVPTEAQLKISPEDVVVISSMAGAVTTAFGEVVDSSEHAADFPDWAAREANGYRLVRWFLYGETRDEYGWFHVSWMFVVPDQYRAETLCWQFDGFPDSPPDWVMDGWRQLLTDLHMGNEQTVPLPLRCPGCNSDNVYVAVFRFASAMEFVGSLRREEDGAEVFAMLNDDPDWVKTSTGKFVCGDCGKKTSVDPDLIVNL